MMWFRPPSGTAVRANPVNPKSEDIVQVYEGLTGRRALATQVDVPRNKLNFAEVPAFPRIEVRYYLE